MGTQPEVETEFNALQFEKQLTYLKDSQDCINTCCQWCLQNRKYHKKIVNSWLNVLKRVKVEQRLILFYLANDVVQYSKRRNYEYVESWGTAIQKATTLVRDEKVKHKILRIFKIWEQRGVYNEEFISDLCGLLSVVPSGPKGDEPHEFQPNYVINKIKTCTKLEKDTDTKLKVLNEHNPKIQMDDGLIASLKDRAHVDDVEKEVDVYVTHMENYINALKLEIKNRINLITVLKQAETQLEADRKDVKVVANAYKMFGTRVKTFQKKLDEHKSTLSSPIPSPDINAPSPSPDSDIELPDTDAVVRTPMKEAAPVAADYNPKVELQQQYSAGYYTPVAPPTTDGSNSFISNGFSSFIGSDLSFSLENLSNTLFNNPNESQKAVNPTPTTETYTTEAPVVQNPPLTRGGAVCDAYTNGHLPLLPPPMPPFSKPDVDYNSSSYTTSYTNTATTNYENSFTPTATFETPVSNYNTSATTNIPGFLDESFEPPAGANPYPPTDTYNPEDDLSTWEPEATWNEVHKTDTPESPPLFEKEGYSDPVEYHDNLVPSGAVDVDHRVLPGIAGDLEDSLSSLGGKDVDHRNLISLTGSPGNSTSNNPTEDHLWNQTDQDYRVPSVASTNTDQDYRVNNFNMEQLKLPPPPPPPAKSVVMDPNSFLSTSTSNPDISKPPPTSVPLSKSPRKIDNTEMMMNLRTNSPKKHNNNNLKIIVDNSREEQQFSLEPPPPLPDLPDDVDANNFLDDLSNDLHEFSNLSDELSNSDTLQDSNNWNQLMPPPMMHFSDVMSPPMNPPNNSMNPPMILMNPPPMNHMNSLMNPPLIRPSTL
ncbi:hypothetical protein NQ317_015206 [Molorchus minor]|uniref:CID domain-containing protein n=1 Tax=Molorchus minor TaxID=1323400 RepID=A0ABQ9JCG7_9CUCU|nr:hypothetical protein NQ317_015206 [Molorchus minor]